MFEIDVRNNCKELNKAISFLPDCLSCTANVYLNGSGDLANLGRSKERYSLRETPVEKMFETVTEI